MLLPSPVGVNIPGCIPGKKIKDIDLLHHYGNYDPVTASRLLEALPDRCACRSKPPSALTGSL